MDFFMLYLFHIITNKTNKLKVSVRKWTLFTRMTIIENEQCPEGYVYCLCQMILVQGCE